VVNAKGIPDDGGASDCRGEFIATFREFPPRQQPQTYNLDQVMQRLQKPAND
jgi:hypothetical protein